MHKYLSVVKAEYAENFAIKIYFSDGSDKRVDFGDFLKKHSHPQFDKYKNIRNFKKFYIVNAEKLSSAYKFIHLEFFSRRQTA